MKNQTLELVTIYPFEVSVTNISEDTSFDYDEWKAKGERAAQFFLENITGVWMDGFYEGLEKFYETPMFSDRRSWARNNETISIAQDKRYTSKKVRKIMLD